MLTVLQDPSVANAPIEQRVAFLRSKNLTQEEIDVSLQRVGSEPAPVTTSNPPAQSSNYGYQQSPAYRQPGPYNGYPPNTNWQQPPPEIPRRDWRDWFIMATVVGGIGYGAYFVAKRYIYPVIAPPTPPQLEQDKASIDASFEKAFALLDQLATDTEELKASEQKRTERLDEAMSVVENVIGEVKDGLRQRESDSRRMRDEVQSLRDLIPKAIKSHEESTDQRLKELGVEMQSLKTLLSNRVGAQPVRPSQSYGALPGTPSNASNGVNSSAADLGNTKIEASQTLEQAQQDTEQRSAQPERSASSTPYGRIMNGRASIPAWQMAAAKKAQDASKDTAESGTAVDGASA